jgi:manganese/iron transport system substrate-binding protein
VNNPGRNAISGNVTASHEYELKIVSIEFGLTFAKVTSPELAFEKYAAGNRFPQKRTAPWLIMFTTFKKITQTFIPILLFIAGLLSFEANELRADEKKIIVCSTTQTADFARQIVGDRCEVISVLAAGEDPHICTPGGNDSANVGRADLCLRNGWNLEGNSWMKTMANNAGKKLVTCIEGVEPLEAVGHEGTAKDPHAWLDPKNAKIYVENIRDAVVELVPEHADEFRMRADLYILQLRALDQWIKRSLGTIPKNQRILITHHDAFGYFCKAYGMKTFSPVGWTTGELTGVSLQRKQEIIDEIRERGVPAIFVETSTNDDLLTGIAHDAGVAVGESLYSDAMGPSGSAGETYIGMMRENVVRIVKGLAPKKE